MKAKITVTFFLMCISFMGFSKVWTVTNSGTVFSPATITIVLGDEVLFSLGNSHNAIEVSKATWDANGNTQLSGGFATDFGGGQVATAQLAVGTHYYVCSPHASLGMKGQIIVQAVTGINDVHSQMDVGIFPNPTSDFLHVNAGIGLFGTSYCLYDQSGNRLITGVIAGQSFDLDLRDLSSGIYFFQLLGTRKEALKVMKK